MKVTPDIIRHEFIGTEGKIAKSQHAGYVGIYGEVIDETKNTFTILHKGKAKSVVKNLAVFNFKFSDGTIVEIWYFVPTSLGNFLANNPGLKKEEPKSF